MRKSIAIVAAGLVLAAAAPAFAYPDRGKCTAEGATILGTMKDDVLEGTEGTDVIVGLAGDDVIYGFGNNDTLCGNRGRDVLYGGTVGTPFDEDYLLGGHGHDTMFGIVPRANSDEADVDDGARDFMGGRFGVDTCYVGTEDFARFCEYVVGPDPGDV